MYFGNWITEIHIFVKCCSIHLLLSLKLLPMRMKYKQKLFAPLGAVFDFYAGNVKRAPNWVIGLGLE
jgi:hypothetical protein